MDTSQAVVPAKRRKQERRYRTNAEKRRIVEEAMADEESVAEVARRHGVNTNLLFNWRKLYRQGLLDQCREATAATLVPVRVGPTSPLAVETRNATGGHIEIELPGEIRLRLHGHVDPEALSAVLTVLRPS